MLTTLINQFAEKVAKMQGIADLETSEKAAAPGAVDPAQQRCRGRRRHHRAAGRRDDPAAARRRHGELLARTGRPELRGQRAVAEGQPPARRGLEQPLSQHDQEGPGRRGADGAAAAGRRDRRDDVAADHQAAGAAAARRALRERRRTAFGRRQQGCAEDHQGVDAAAGVPVRRRRAGQRTWRNRSRRRSPRWASR